MQSPARFLRALGHALELRQRSNADVTLRRAADEACLTSLTELLRVDSNPVFHFTPVGVEYGPRPLPEFAGWTWATRLAARSISYLDLTGLPDPGELALFLDYAGTPGPPATPAPRLAGLRFGPVPPLPREAVQDDYPLDEELGVMRRVFTGAVQGDRVSLGDVRAVVASLSALVAEADEPVLPLLHLSAREQYQPAHALNSALLCIVVAEELGLGGEERRECGVGGLLHDIGMVRLPTETLVGEKFTSQDRARVRGHPLEGARMLLRQGDALDGAAVACYEHHLRPDGNGYPRLSYPREPHLLSRVVAVCDAFDALLAPRPDRPPLNPAGALHELERNAVSHFDPRVVAAFSAVMMRSVRGGGLTLTSRLY